MHMPKAASVDDVLVVPEVTPAPAPRDGLAPEQLQVLVEQQRRILRRSTVMACAVNAAALDPQMVRDIIAEFLGDVTEAARTIGAILQPRV